MLEAALLALLLGLSFAFDLGYGRGRALLRSEAWALTYFWLALPLLYALGLHLGGSEYCLPFLASYAVAKSLTLDHLIVIAVLFSFFRSSVADQQGLLQIALISALAFRSSFAGLAAYLMDFGNWLPILFGVLLLFSSLKLLLISHRRLWPREIPRLPTFGMRTVTYHILVASLLFAVDSVPATLAVTSDATVLLAANLFAILGMRAFYYAVTSFIGQYRFVKGALGILLALLAISVLSSWNPSPALILAITVGLVGTGMLLSRLRRGKGAVPNLGPLVEEAAVLTLTQARRLIITVVGLSVLVIGILMIFLPGPAIVFVPLGLIILSAEWAWARQLLKRFVPKDRL